MFAVLVVLALWLALIWGEAATPTSEPILSGPLVKLDIKDAEVAAVRGKPKGTLTIGMHFALDPGWLDPLEHIPAITQQHYDYLVHDALIKPMPQGEFTYSLAEHAEITADFTKAAFRLRPGLRFHDGHALTTADVKWTYQNYKGVQAKTFHDKLERIEIVDDPAPSSSTLRALHRLPGPLQWHHHWHWLDSPQALLRAGGEGRVQNPPHRRRAVQICESGSRGADGF
jgi:ABC-type transport system substrate-binding protein